MWTIWQEANTRQAHWFRYNGRKWDGELFNVEWWGGGRVNGGDIFKQINSPTKSTWVGTAIHWGQLVIWWIWILAAHHVWPPHRLLYHFLYRPPCPRDEAGANAATRAGRWFWGENLLQGKCNAKHERVGTAEYDLPSCEARGWNGGSQASLDKLLGCGFVQFFLRKDDKEYG